MSRCRRVTTLLVILLNASPVTVAAQGEDPQEVGPYFRALEEHFRVPSGEVEVLAAWGLPPDHVAVVLFVARRSGASPDAVVMGRRGGWSWHEVARRLGLDASTFHVLVAQDAPLGRLAPVYERFATTPRTEWSSIELGDAEVVDLVNIRVLGSVLAVPPVRVLEVAGRTGSYVAAYDRLGPPG